MPALGLLDPLAQYDASFIDLTRDSRSAAHWRNLFHAQRTVGVAAATETLGGGPVAARRAEDAFDDVLRRLDARLDSGTASIRELAALRETTLREHGIADAYLALKRLENEQALALLPSLLSELDAMPADGRTTSLAVGLFAGNLFDVGAPEVADRIAGGSTRFLDARHRVPPRPWLHDDLDAFTADAGRGFSKALVFVDNSGADLVLGVIPFARELLRRGCRVGLAANRSPALNDVTYRELVDLMPFAAHGDAVLSRALATNRWVALDSGNDSPLIDLSDVSDSVAAFAQSVDLVVLEGMGRALESNYDARFSVPSLKVATVKDRRVAECIRGKAGDCVFRYER